ncbi:WD40 repeat domain-containing protein, partial [Actinomadura verrucosospora]|uniref:WD40 repeat domain-containing protein n=1 Tax=Actinomadura verrucosospora TaxID=46165 RepID=UPI0015632C21
AWWYRTRDPEWRAVVVDTAAIALHPPARLASAALADRLENTVWEGIGDAGLDRNAAAVRDLLADDDEGVREAAARFCAQVRGDMVHRLWRAGPDDPVLRRAMFANPAPPDRDVHRLLWQGYLEAAGPLPVDRDPELLAALLRWPVREEHKAMIGGLWARTRDPELRRLVLDLGAVAAAPAERVLTLALLDRLGELRPGDDAGSVGGVLADDDPELRDRMAGFCRTAVGGHLEAFWSLESPRRDTPLRRLLLQNPARPPAGTVNLLWSAWLERPSPELTDALVRWGRPARFPAEASPAERELESLSVIPLNGTAKVLLRPPVRAALVTALGLGDHPLSEIAERRVTALGDRRLVEEVCAAAAADPALAWVCVKHGLAPEDTATRAVFFLLTGQPEQYRALDPDGGLLSLGYAAADAAARDRIRQAMLAAGELDLVRVVAGDDRRARIGEMTRGEARYLAEQLAARKEWERLWALVQDLPIGTGAELVRLFDGWLPRDEDARRVFGMYLETEPAAVALAARYLDERWPLAVRQATIRFRGRVNDVSFAPDAPLLAVASNQQSAGVIDLREGVLAEHHDGFQASVGRVLHVGGGAFVAGERTNRHDRPCRLLRCGDGGTAVLHTVQGSVTSLAATGPDGAFAAGTRSGRLLSGAGGGGRVTSRPLTALGLPEGDWARSIAAHPASGRLAVLGRSLVVTGPPGQRPASSAAEHLAVRAGFVSEDVLACAGRSGTVTVLHRRGGALARSAHMRIEGLGGIAALPGTGRLAVADRRGRLLFLDAATLAPVWTHRSPGGRHATSVHASPAGDLLAVGHDNGETDLFDLRAGRLPSLVGRALAGLVPRDLDAVAAARAVAAGGHPAHVASTVALLHACLEHRFRFDIEIGGAVALTAGDYDISL